MDVIHNLLLLDYRYTPDSQLVWKTAIKRGWATERINYARVDIERKLLPKPTTLRYYGNVLHQELSAQYLPIRFLPIDIYNLTNLYDFTKRKIELIKTKDVKLPLDHSAFYKCPYVKWIESRVYKTGESFEGKPEDWLYKQEPIEIIDEIRCFIVDGLIQTASWYRINKEFIPEELTDYDIMEKLQNLTSQIWKKCLWPRGVVFDFGRLKNGEWIMIEVNEAWASGTYGCSGDGVFNTIILSQE